MAKFPCFKCNGSGEVSFKHIANGVCFQCGGTGKLDYQPRAKADPHPNLLVPEADLSTVAQWDHFNRLCTDDRRACQILRSAGAPMATRRYVTKAVMSKAIELAQ